MSELKAIESATAVIENVYLVYRKAEADKVIAELKEENEKLKATPEQIMKEVFDKCLIYPKEMVRLDDAYKLAVSLRNQKYKRGVAMAEMCRAKYDEEDAKVNGRGASWDYISDEMKYWERWHNRWLELAEKFKDKDAK